MKYLTLALHEQYQLCSGIQFSLRSKYILSDEDYFEIEKTIKNIAKSEVAQRIKENAEYMSILNRDEKEYEDRYFDELEEITNKLAKYLPDNIKKQVKDLRLIYLNAIPKQLVMEINEWGKDVEYRWKKACEDSDKNYEEIFEFIPNSMKDFCHSMHDKRVLAITRPVDDVLVLKFEDEPWGEAFAVFQGVQLVEIDEKTIGDWWLYDEIYVDGDYFDYQVLLVKSEFRIIAREVKKTVKHRLYMDCLMHKYLKIDELFEEVICTIMEKQNAIGVENLTDGEKIISSFIHFRAVMFWYKVNNLPGEMTEPGFSQLFELYSITEVNEFLKCFNKIGADNVAHLVEEAIYIFQNEYIDNREDKFKVLENKIADIFNNNEFYSIMIQWIRCNITLF